MTNSTINSEKEEFTVSIPFTHEIKLKLAILMMKGKAKRYNVLVRSLSKNRYGGSEVGNRPFSLTASMVTKSGMNGIAIIVPNDCYRGVSKHRH